MSWDLSEVTKKDIKKMLDHLDDYADSIKAGALESEWEKADHDLLDLLNLYRIEEFKELKDNEHLSDGVRASWSSEAQKMMAVE